MASANFPALVATRNEDKSLALVTVYSPAVPPLNGAGHIEWQLPGTAPKSVNDRMGGAWPPRSYRSPMSA